LEDVDADCSVRTDVRMVYSGLESQLRGFERVASWEMDVQEKYSPIIRSTFWTHNSGRPVIVVVTNWSCRAVIDASLCHFLEFLLDSLDSHVFVIIIYLLKVFTSQIFISPLKTKLCYLMNYYHLSLIVYVVKYFAI